MAAGTRVRTTHHHDGELVVFLIGMRVNKPWRPDAWLPTFLAMRPMLTELSREPGSGLLGLRLAFSAGGPVLIQYWDSHEKLYAYASDSAGEHRPAWAAFNRKARAVPGAVGIWHETFVVDRAESVYVDMPVAGLAGATSSVPVGTHHDRAQDRLADGAARGGSQPAA
jgi:hypothetical protein